MSESIPLYHIELVRDRSVPFKQVSKVEQAAEVFHDLLDKSPVEQLAVIHMDASGKMVGVEKVGLGTLTMVSVTMGEIFRGALIASVPTIILGHNHPSDDPTPSGPDWDLTDKARLIGMALGINVWDHIVVAPNGKHVSMRTKDAESQQDFINSMGSLVDMLPPDLKRELEDKLIGRGLPPLLPGGDFPPMLGGRKPMPKIGTNLGDLLRKKLSGG